MLLERPQFREAFYGAVRDDALDNEADKKLLVFVSTAEADSVCAIRILSAICNAEHMYKTVVPVSSYAEMEAYCREEFKDEDAARTVLLINCGAGENVREMLRLKENVRITVIDAHRPIHLSYNNPDDGNTLFWHDPAAGVDAAPIPYCSSSEDSDSESDFGDDENESPASKRHRIENGLPAPSEVRRKERRARRDESRRKRLEHYARGTHWGMPATRLLWDLAFTMDLVDSRMLWWYIIAVTEQFVHRRVADERYINAVQELEALIGNVATEMGGEFEEFVDTDTGSTTLMRVPQHNRITAVDDLRVGLLRHWSLLEALRYSPYVAVRLHTWRDAGQHMLHLLLARCGVPLKQAKLAYSQMAPGVKRRMPERLTEEAKGFQLMDISFRSFQVNNGWNQAGLSASDAVLALTALLEGGESDASDPQSNRDRFWRSWEALSEREGATLREGLDQARKMQHAIVQDGGMITDRIAFRTKLRVAMLFDLSQADIAHRALLARPVALVRLAMFLHDAYIQDAKKALPVVVIGPAGEERRCLVAGYSGQPKLTDGQGSPFGQLFEHAGKTINALPQHDLFDASIVEIAETDAKRFGTALTASTRFVAAMRGGARPPPA